LYHWIKHNLEAYVVKVMKRKQELAVSDKYRPYFSESDFEIEDIDLDGVHIIVNEFWSYGGEETHYYTISLDELFNDNWEENYLAEQKKLLEKDNEENKKQQSLSDEAERQLYERLKKKYEK
jgi:hypothetical protein